MPVQFYFTDVSITLSNRTALKKFILTIFKSEKRSCQDLNIIFCSDTYLLELNRQFLQHDYYTDILTFDLGTGKDMVSGEIYISTDRVKDNAQNLGATLKEELHRVIFHGVLHLCGYKDKTRKQIDEIRERENHYLRRYFG